ncbi:ELMO domain-containing protein A-like isoform X3 [Gossypium australe]|uniref:ELMO domain-containing protein A-like isoform X3 n=1 Tax=Gossypium australe TaxID=47621 RepID=A0A5B6VVZ3_9ROSI|nr:ELMO domain-containing protein A-like isoform X3 [Gossypium australe]
MRPGALRRRLDHGDVGRMSNGNYMMTGLHGLDEPLLGNRDYDGGHSEGKTLECIWVEGQRKEHLHWAALLFTNLIEQWAQWIGEILSVSFLFSDMRFYFTNLLSILFSLAFPANIVLGSASFIARILRLPSNTQSGSNLKLLEPALNPLQEARLRSLQQRLGIPYDGSRLEHQEALKQLWKLAYPDRELPSLKSGLWKDMGWQGPDPSTDFRGGGFISLENLIFFAKKYPQSFQRLLHKQDGNRSELEYPFAVAGINISFMLVQMLDLQSGKPSSRAGRRFLELLAEDEMAFDDLYCVTFRMMDAQWLVKRASYMEFNEILKSTRTRLEHELSLESVSRVKDLPAYSLLKR